MSDSESDLSSEQVVKEAEFQGTEETHRAFNHGTELIPWYDTHTGTHTCTCTIKQMAHTSVFFLGMYCRYSQMFTSLCCRGLQSSTMTRTAISQLAVCCACNLTTQHSLGVIMSVWPTASVYIFPNLLLDLKYIINVLNFGR